MSRPIPSVLSPRSVLVLDSGIGGMSVVGAIRAAVPGVALTYIADTARFPYGGRPAGEIVAAVSGLVAEAVARQPVDAVVVACNTASTVVLDPLRARFTPPIIGVVPPVKVAAAVSRSRVVALLATEATARGPYLDRLIRDFAADCRVVRLACPGLADLAEAKMRGRPVDRDALRRLLAPLAGVEGLDTVVLGCTHYPFLRPELAAVLGDGLTWLDPAEPVARHLARVLAGLPPPPPRVLPPDTAWTTGPVDATADALAPLLSDLGFQGPAQWASAEGVADRGG